MCPRLLFYVDKGRISLVIRPKFMDRCYLCAAK